MVVAIFSRSLDAPQQEGVVKLAAACRGGTDTGSTSHAVSTPRLVLYSQAIPPEAQPGQLHVQRDLNGDRVIKI